MAVLRLVLCFVLGVSLLPMSAASQDRRDLVKTVEKSVGRVWLPVGGGNGYWGSGYVVSKDGRSSDSFLFLTNNHVIDVQGALTIEVFYAQDDDLHKFEGEVLIASPKHDMALLRIEPVGKLNFEPSILPLAEYTVESGDSVFAVGFPAFSDDYVVDGGDNSTFKATITDGIVGKRFMMRWAGSTPVEVLQHSAAINGGNSGGPLVNECGTVVGLNTAGPGGRNSDVAGAFFSSSPDAILDFLNDTDAEPRMSGRACSSFPPFLTDTRYILPIVGALFLAGSLVAVGLMQRNKATAAVVPVGVTTGRIRQPENRSTPTALLRVSVGGKTTALTSGALQKGISLGRSDTADIPVMDPSVSRNHAELRLRDRKLYVIDQGSTQGTLVDGKKLEPKRPKQINTQTKLALGGVTIQLAKGS